MLAFVMAAGFIADTASLPLVVSNLVNIVSADFFAIGFREYASVMVTVDLAAILTTTAMLHLFFRRDIPPARDMALLKAPVTAIKIRRRSAPAGACCCCCWSAFSFLTRWGSGQRHRGAGSGDPVCCREARAGD